MSFYLAWIWLVVLSARSSCFAANAEAAGLPLSQPRQVTLYLGM